MSNHHSITLIVGLGNPGAEFSRTYHNAGMMAVDAIGGPLVWKSYKNLFMYAKGGRAGGANGNAVFVKPLVFMNDSGRAVRAAARMFKADPPQIVVIHDDSDLPVGAFKCSSGRGAAGHHGVESTIAALGSNEFLRVRIGIRNPKEKLRKKASAFVLQQTRAADKKTFAEVFAAIRETIFG